MNKKTLATVIIILTTTIIYGQSDLCFDNNTGTYWPIEAGRKIEYSSRGESFTSYFNGDSLKVGDKYFLKEIKEYIRGKTRTNCNTPHLLDQKACVLS